MGDMHTTALSPTPLGSPLRAQFPILAQRINGQPLVYLDNAATTQMPLVVLDAMRQFETTARANIHRGVHTLSQRATDVFENARETVKRFVGATQAHELVFTSGTTEALNLVTQGLVHGLDGRTAAIGPGDEIIVSGLEHHANLVPWQQAAKRSGATLRILLPNAHGQLQADDLARLLSQRTRVFALTACANARPCWRWHTRQVPSPCWTRPRPWPTAPCTWTPWPAISWRFPPTRCTAPWAWAHWWAAARRWSS